MTKSCGNKGSNGYLYRLKDFGNPIIIIVSAALSKWNLRAAHIESIFFGAVLAKETIMSQRY